MHRRNPLIRWMALLTAFLLLLGLGASLAEEPKEPEEPLTLLLIGVDTLNPDDPGRSDTMIVAQINPETGDVRLLSFLRDLYVPIPGHGKTRLNAAYYYGGADLLKRTLEKNFGVSVDRTIAVNFSLMADLIDQIGGVDVEVSKKELRQLNITLSGYNKRIGANAYDGLVQDSGLQRLNGKQALSYSRIRKIDSDFQRTGRQHKVIQSVVARLSEMDFLSLAKLVFDNIDKIETDITLDDVNRILPSLMAHEELSFRSAHVPFEGTSSDQTIDEMMVLVPNLERNQRLAATFLSEE